MSGATTGNCEKSAIAGRLYCVVFTQRGDVIRVISLRKANYRENIRYEQATETDSPYT